jgi:prepilin-type N-terminal cleavage/methylation domain-containing protein
MSIPQHRANAGSSAFTLVEVVVALAISTILFAGIILSFSQTAYRAEWSSYSLAAQNLALQGLEQARAAAWDPLAATPVDKCVQTNFPTTTTNILDVPVSKGNITYATNTWSITTVGTATYPMKMIRVECTWPFIKDGKQVMFKNSVATFRAPNQ